MTNVLLQVFLTTVFIFTLTKEHIYKNKKFNRFYLFSALVAVIINFSGAKTLIAFKVPVLFITQVILLKILLKKNTLHSVVLPLIILLIFAMIEIFSVLLMTVVLRITFEELLKSTLFITIGNTLSTCISLIYWYIIYKFFPCDKYDTINNKLVFKENIFIFSVTVLLILPKFLGVIMMDFNADNILIFSGIIESFILLYALIQKTLAKYLQRQLKVELENAKLYNSSLTTTIDSLRGFKHDFNNVVATIEGYLRIDDLDGIKDYFENGLSIDVHTLKYLSFLTPEKIKEPGIFNLVLNKCLLAQSEGVEPKVEISTVLEKGDLKDYSYKFSKILGILLDNAIEATKNSKYKNKNFHFEILKDYDSNSKTIIISNKFDNSNKLTVEKCFEKDFSTKKIKSGFGLYEVKKLIDSIPYLTISTEIRKNLFVQTIHIDLNGNCRESILEKIALDEDLIALENFKHS